MKQPVKKTWLFFSVIPIAFIVFGSYTAYKQADDNKNQVLVKALIQGLNSGHYQPQPVNDQFSNKVFNLYIDRLDFNKKFFLQQDVDNLKKYFNQIDDQVKNADYTFFDLSNELVEKRINEAEEYYKDLLDKPFDFGTDEEIQLDPEKLPYARTKAELKEAWRKYLKYQVMLRLAESIEAQEKKDSVTEIKTTAQLEEDARKKVEKSTQELFDRMKKVDKDDRLSAYLNSIANIYDPHTEYFAPREKENFDIAFTGRLEGIGATLQDREGYIRVQSIVPGSASWKQGQLKVGDIILKVAQGRDEPVDIVGMRIDNAVQLIRGKKGTEVRLTVKKVDGSIVIIPIIRDVVIIEETYAQSAIINEDKKIGYIRLPSFYADFEHKGGRNSQEDIRKEVEKLKKENVQGIILDLRDNGGGSLQDVVDMAGLFIERGPVVQVKTAVGEPYILEDKNPAIQYNGPLVILVNYNSASASEILAAAIQDYKRGVVIGSSSTFGKGTVQRIFDLDESLPPLYASLKPIGSLKLTVQKFYRVNGGTTQLRGVVPDIILPDAFTYIPFGEKEQDYPLPWDEIKPVRHDTWNTSINIDRLKNDSRTRINTNPGFKLINQQALKFKRQQENNTSTLNLKKYMDEQKRVKQESKELEEQEKNRESLRIAMLSADIINPTDTIRKARIEDFHKKLTKDIYVQEAYHVLRDMSK